MVFSSTSAAMRPEPVRSLRTSCRQKREREKERNAKPPIIHGKISLTFSDNVIFGTLVTASGLC